MKYAVIATSGKQYQVTEGQELVIDRLKDEPGAKINFDQVILTVDGDSRKLGTPTVEGSKVQATVIEHLKGKKIRVAKFKAKSRYRRVTGHRQLQTKVSITKIA